MTHNKRALVVGATGVVGRNMMRHLLRLGDWEVTAVSRRTPDLPGTYAHVPVDLLDASDARAKLGKPLGITHVFYSAYVERATWADGTAPNNAMLTNVMDAIEPVSPALQHVNLMHGTKWYGSHIGPFKTPAKEDDPRGPGPNFYHDQQDFIAQRQRGKSWYWTTVRPHAICGFATGNPMNLVNVIAVYASISKALGQPLSFSGTEANYNALYQCVDAGHLAKAVTWMATEPRCGNQAFNITNGDIFRWKDLWPRIARHFAMEVGPQKHISLVETMRDKATLWSQLVQQHGLQPIPYENLVAWKFGDSVFGSGYDMINSMTKARQFGFHDVVDTEEMFMRIFDELRAGRVIP